MTGVLKVKVTKLYEDSTVAKVLDLVENSGSRKASVEKFITKVCPLLHANRGRVSHFISASSSPSSSVDSTLTTGSTGR